jgi:hypothetical protein
LRPPCGPPFGRTVRGRFYCAGVSAAAVAWAHVKTVLIEPLAYLGADKLASWGLILRVPARKRDRIAGNDADDRRAHSFSPSGRLSLRAPCWRTRRLEGSALWPFVTNKAFPMLGVSPILGRKELLAKAR